MTRKKVETPEVKAPKTSVGAKLMLDRINQLQEENDKLVADICELNSELLLQDMELDRAVDIVLDASNYEVNFFSPNYYRNAMKLQEKAAIYVAKYYLDALNFKGS
jgi:hypothetical protein